MAKCSRPVPRPARARRWSSAISPIRRAGWRGWPAVLGVSSCWSISVPTPRSITLREEDASMSETPRPVGSAEAINDELLSSLRPPTWRWYALVLSLGAVLALGLAAFTYQMMNGMYVTGKNRPVMWGFYITGF